MSAARRVGVDAPEAAMEENKPQVLAPDKALMGE
jgi:hypothetical protein